MGDQQPQEAKVEASRRQECFEGNMVQIDIPTEEMKSSSQIKPLIALEDMKMTEEILSRNENLELHENDIFQLESPLANTLLDIAARYGNEKCMKEICQLINAKTDSAASEIQGLQASGLAERVQAHGYNKNFKLLKDTYLSKRGDVHAYMSELHENEIFKQESPQGDTVLHIEARYGNDECAEEIARQVPHLLTAKNSNGDTALHVAAKAGHISTLKKLLLAHLGHSPLPRYENPKEALNAILVKNNQGNTFFHEALLNSHKGSDEERFEAGFRELVGRAAAFETNNEKKSVLYLAIEAGYKEVVDQELAKMIPHGPDYVPEGKSPLLAAIMKRDKGILDFILEKMPKWIHLRDTEGRTPLHYAASIGYLEGVQYLLGKCASCPDERDKYGFSPLHLASNEGHVKVVHELLKLKYCPYPREILDDDGRNILHLAVESGKFNVVSYILKATNHELEKMINDKDANGNTPLHLATLLCHPKIVLALTWDKRVDLTLVNRNNQTALDAFEQFPLENTSLRQRLTWSALISAGVQSGEPLPSSIKVPPQSTNSLRKEEVQNMDQYKDRINTLMLVSTLIITVTFAAGFTMPGGTNSSEPGQGMAFMLNRIWFKLFIFCITISMYGAISVTIILIWAQLGDITLALLALNVARPFLGVTLATLSLAFLAGVHLVISDLSWLATTSLIMGVIFIFMLLLLYILLWFPSSSSITVVRYISYYPFLLLASLVEPDETGGT